MSDLELLEDVLKYIADREETIDGEWGMCREASEIIHDGDMHELYFRVRARIAEIKAQQEAAE